MNARLRSSALLVGLAALSCGPTGSGSHPGVGEIASEAAALTLCPGGSTVQGVDISSYQGVPNWGQVAGAGIQFAYVKASQGNYYQNSTFAQNWAALPGTGILRGAYHWLDGTVNGTTQADYFLATVGPFGPGDLPPMLDWECNATSCGNAGAASVAADVQAATDFIAEVKAKTGLNTIVYTYPGFWNGIGNPAQGAASPLWIADTGVSCPDVVAPWSSFVIWQYGQSAVAGVSGTVDRDEFNGTLAQLQQLGSGGGGACTTSIFGKVGQGGAISGGACGSLGAPVVPKACGGIPSGDGLGQGDTVSSCDGRFSLAMQTDGNFVLYERGKALWNTGTNGKGGTQAAMQGDGNLVVYSSGGCPLWASNTGGNPGASLAVQSDGNLVIYSSSGKAIWATGTGPIPEPPATCGTLSGGEGLGYNDIVGACGACFSLIFQDDGNLVLYKSSQFLQAGGVVWQSGTSGTGYMAELGTDGNLNVYSSSGCSIWSTNTGGNNGASLAVQDDGNLVIYSSAKKVLWNSGSVACNGGCNCQPIPQQPSNDAISIVNWQDGHSELFAKTVAGDLDHSWNGAAAGNVAWATPVQAGTGADCGMSAGYWDLHPEVFSPLANASTGHLWWNATNGWNGFQPFGGTDITQLAALLWPDGHEEVFGLGGDGAIWHNWFGPSVGWAGWSSLGGSGFTSGPGAMVWGDGHAELFALDGSGDLWHSWSGTGALFPGGWAAWAQLPTTGPMASKPVPVRWPDGHVELFVRGADDQLYHSNFSTKSGWPVFSALSPGSTIVGQPSAIMNPSSVAEVFARDPNGKVVHTFGDGTTYSTFSSLGNAVGTASDPFGWIRGDGNAEVFAIDASGNLIQIYRDPKNSWGTWSTVGSGFDSCAPPLAAPDAGVPDAGVGVPDAGSQGFDAGSEPGGDAGVGESLDAGSEPADGGDASGDAGSGLGDDGGGQEPDAGSVVADAGEAKPDGGQDEVDAGEAAPDAGPARSGAGSTTSLDAGATLESDAGAEGDGNAGQPNPIDAASGCGCGTGGSPAEAGLFWFALLATTLERRRRSPR